MKKIILMSLFVFLSFGLIVSEASAKRFGGGRGFGSYRSKTLFSRNVSAKKPPVTNKTSRFRSGLSGFLLGGLLASLFFHNGLGTALFGWMLIGLIVAVVLGLFARRRQQDLGNRR
ncbi:hypothetical protein [Legionella sp. 16cNR16C]|uniref:hypothetical protein n=1 Tax=Legionella sp. 16cNR16C TaxID=2905656 RepID=UPI001E594E1E|nr:hypothetical protein [Legionella sp. 16cNR16C]MCE3044799.1 hypothetical protein [Legionella sp. 16cNR16C]